MTEPIKILYLQGSVSERVHVEEILNNAGLKTEIIPVFLEDFDPSHSFPFPDIVLVEYFDPTDTISAVLKYFGAPGAESPVIMIADAATEASAVDFLKSGCEDYLLKDRLLRLPRSLQSVLERKRLKQQLEDLLKEREQVRQEMEEAEEKYGSIFGNSMDGILLGTTDGDILAANPAACEMFQMTEEEICRLGRSGILDKKDQRVGEAISTRSLTGRVKWEISLKRKDGSSFPVEITSSAFTDAQGKEKTCVVIRDVTERKQASEEIRKSEELYKHLFQASPMPRWIYDRRSLGILDVNMAACRLYGYSREEFLSLKITDLRSQEDVPLLLDHLEKVKDQREIVNSGIFEHLKKDGTKMRMEVFGYRLPFEENEWSMVTCHDLTEREAVLHKYKEKSAKLQAAERIARLGYWEFHLSDDSLYWSEEVYNILGMDRNSQIPSFEALMEIIHPEDIERFKAEHEATLKGDRNLNSEHRMILANEEIIWVQVRGKVQKDSRGNPSALEGTIQDITERKIATEKLMLSEARHKAILQSQTNYLIRMDFEGNYTYCNDKFVKDFSWIYPENNLLGERASKSIKKYHRKRSGEVFQECIDNPNQVFQVEIDKLKQDGGTKSTLWDFVCLTNGQGEPVEVQCVGIDITDWVKAKQELVESNKRYELVTKATTDAIWDWDYVSDHLYWGEGFCTLFGYETDQFTPVGSKWEDNIHPEDAEAVFRNLEERIKGKENSWKAEYRFRKADGEYAFVVDRGTLIRDEENTVIRMVGAVQDITEKKKLEELLEKSISLSRVGSFEADLTKNEIFWSPMTKEIHEVDMDFTPTFENISSFFKEHENKKLLRKAYDDTIKKGLSFDMEVQINTAKGKVRWVRIMGQPEQVEGNGIRINGSFQDIDKLKRVELEALKTSEEKELILESIGDAFIALDSNWIVTYWNKHAEKHMNIPKERILGKNFWKVFPWTINSKFYSMFNKAVEENSIEDFEEYFEKTKSWFDVTAYPSAHGLSVYFRDVTARKKSELQLVELNKDLQVYTDELVTANKGLEQFSYIVSHNLRSPVANILGLAELLKLEEYPEEVKSRLQEELFANVKRLDTIITDLNAILQVKVDISEKKEEVNLSDLVGSIKSSIEHLIQKEQVQIVTEFPEEMEFSTVRSYLHSIFSNLIFNSIKYRQPDIPPVITIRAERTDGSLILSFKDNGIGIDLVKKGDQVFGLYKRFHNHVEGKGMGLFMVKTQVEMLGGKISILSEVNKGTEFLLEFKEDSPNFSADEEQD